MDELSNFEKKHSAGGDDAAFTYQFYSFVYQLLKLEKGEAVGYETKDDVHIESSTGHIKLIQVKHTIQKRADGTPINLTSLDSDLWKTLSNWIDWVKTSKKTVQELDSISYVLFTNKNIGARSIINTLDDLNENKISINDIINELQRLSDQTKDEDIQKYINNIKSFDKRKLTRILKSIVFETGNDNIISKIKKELELICRFNPSSLEKVYKLLISSIFEDKFSAIKGNTNFSLSYDDFNQKYRNCFEEAYDRENLPIRDIPIETSLDFELLKKEIYIRQLNDIYAINSDMDIIKAHHCKLAWDNHMLDWNRLLLPEDYKVMKANAIRYWDNSFQEAYHSLHVKLRKDPFYEFQEEDIISLAFGCLSKVRNRDIFYRKQNLDTILSNGFFYTLANKPPVIGWHFFWEKLYK